MTYLKHNTSFEPGKPKVSILLPNLNTRPFLKERITTIRKQTLTDWELIIVDSHSEDGSWEYFQEIAENDNRIRISQSPRAGIYAGLNECIRLARGEYIYFATSDDTMTPDCLEKMVKALYDHPECGLAVCLFRVIDENGNEIPDTRDKWVPNQVFGDKLNRIHVRYPPQDTLVNCAWDTTWTTLTQLLIRRIVLEKIRDFCTEFGSAGDIEWNIRSSLLTPRVHVPEYLATWRRWPGQATKDGLFSPSEWYTLAIEMIRHAYETAKLIDPNSVSSISLRKLLLPQEQEYIRASIRECNNHYWKKLLKLIIHLYRFPYPGITYIIHRIFNPGGAFGLGLKQVHKYLKEYDLLKDE